MAATSDPDPAASRHGTLDGGRLLAGLGALALLISLFLDWYGPPDGAQVNGATDEGITAWTSFELIDILLAVLSLATIAWALDAVTRRPDRELVPSRLGTVAGPIALMLVVVSLISEPPAVTFFDPELKAGAWIALAGAAVMTVGGLLAIARISVVVAARDRGAGRQSTATRRETETRPLAGDPARREPPGL